MDILLTNDDGIRAVGLRALYGALIKAGHRVHVAAPMTEQSAVGHSVTLFSPLRVKQVEETGFSGLGISGTPADCVKLALSHLLPKKPDMIVSGINSGANVGVDVLYSGTVSAATEGALAGIPAMAVSVDDYHPEELSAQAEYAVGMLGKDFWSGFPRYCVLNLNFPSGPLADAKGLKVCRQTSSTYRDWYDERTDPRGNPYYWLCGVIPPENVDPDSDRGLLSRGYITVTPLTFDLTHAVYMETLSRQLA
ncbi:5'/3'-nucleotidase SurE [Desulfomicrobium baculatum]|uniref:5'-nucleotidase SurE n=1 Tax=Desulfomicrobium baculatum (strain DSM 4028 / VKM B-1378 / X) TaxID=525897 RepID=C7LSK7_DESBD|nr:5'/3'-nucleotidase SurE [Desulfomicrobium baculatum]ACU88221.1 stationary-phase survival protein SurE [Desulfomicrobium baculatum DSM 4028]